MYVYIYIYIHTLTLHQWANTFCKFEQVYVVSNTQKFQISFLSPKLVVISESNLPYYLPIFED